MLPRTRGEMKFLQCQLQKTLTQCPKVYKTFELKLRKFLSRNSVLTTPAGNISLDVPKTDSF